MFWKTTNKAWLIRGERCAIILNGKAAEGIVAQANGDISAVELDNGEIWLRPNEGILVTRDGERATGHG